MSPSWLAWMDNAALAPRLCFVLIGAAMRGGLLLVLTTAVVRLWPRTSAAQRHVVWAVGCCSLLLLPVLSLIVPAWRVPVPVLATTVVPVMDRTHQGNQHSVSIAVNADNRDVHRGIDTPVSQPLPTTVWFIVLLGVWGSGALVVLTVLLDNQRHARRLVSDALPLTDVRILAVFARARSTVRISRVESLVKLHPSTVPIVCGVLRSAVVLPASVLTWDEDRLYNILLHELAHIKRYDTLTQTVAFLACAFYWFNPLVWLAVRRLQAEQEQACDDTVLTAGRHPHEYAIDLLELTQAIQATRTLSWAALPFARPSELQRRMQSIIDQSRPRSFVSRWRALAVLGVGLGAIYPLVGLTPHMMAAKRRFHVSNGEQPYAKNQTDCNCRVSRCWAPRRSSSAYSGTAGSSYPSGTRSPFQTIRQNRSEGRTLVEPSAAHPRPT